MYLFLSLFILPTISITLKTRKHKMKNLQSQTNELVTFSNISELNSITALVLSLRVSLCAKMTENFLLTTRAANLTDQFDNQYFLSMCFFRSSLYPQK